jgi:hypothetical protein
MSSPLTVREHMILELEGSWWKYPGAKESAILETVGMRLTRYHQVLGALLERPEAQAAYPMTVRRLRSLAARRREQRTMRARQG